MGKKKVGMEIWSKFREREKVMLGGWIVWEECLEVREMSRS
jgi:hypothetical protein